MRALVVLLITLAPLASSADELPPLASRSVTQETADRWHRGRVLYGIGSVTGLLGSALTLTSVILVGVTGYPCDPNDPIHNVNPTPNDACNPNSPSYRPSSPTDPAPLLAYIGSSTSALGFVLSASGLGYQHYLLNQLSADPGRAMFGTGTAFGVLGFASVGLSYFFGFTNYLNPHDQGLAILSTTITGTALCLLGGILYTADEAKLQRIWKRISTF